jgi:hypothetical protein
MQQQRRSAVLTERVTRFLQQLHACSVPPPSKDTMPYPGHAREHDTRARGGGVQPAQTAADLMQATSSHTHHHT